MMSRLLLLLDVFVDGGFAFLFYFEGFLFDAGEFHVGFFAQGYFLLVEVVHERVEGGEGAFGAVAEVVDADVEGVGVFPFY